MSLILEALRRSEAERKRGKAPSLLDGAPTPRPRERPLWPIAAAGLALGLLIAAGAAWWMPRQPPPMPTPAPTPSVVPSAVPYAVATPAPPVAAPAPPPSPAPTAKATPAPAPPPVAIEQPVAAPPEVPVVPTAPPSVPTPPAAAIAPSPSITDPLLGPATGDLPINELPASTRAALPPLRLSMHVFNDDGTQRFAIVDGTRLREGDSMGEVQVLEIRRDGLRLAWQGRTLWLPR